MNRVVVIVDDHKNDWKDYRWPALERRIDLARGDLGISGFGIEVVFLETVEEAISYFQEFRSDLCLVILDVRFEAVSDSAAQMLERESKEDYGVSIFRVIDRLQTDGRSQAELPPLPIVFCSQYVARGEELGSRGAEDQLRDNLVESLRTFRPKEWGHIGIFSKNENSETLAEGIVSWLVERKVIYGTSF